MATRLRVLFFGLEPVVADGLKAILGQHEIVETGNESASACAADIAAKTPDVVFCGSQKRCRESALQAVAISRPWTPVVVASRQPETSEWLDALEAGAADYCSAPFESRQVSWILESILGRPRTAAA